MKSERVNNQTVNDKPRILLGVTADISLSLMRGMPAYLVSQGWDVHVVTSPGERLSQLAELPGVTTHSLAMERNPSPVKDLIALIRWVSLLKSVRPDVISVGTPKAGLLGSVAGRITRVPKRVYHLRGLRFETATGIQFKVLTFLEKVTSAAATHVLSVSHSMRDKFVAMKLTPAQKAVVIGAGSSNGVQLEEFAATLFGAAEIAKLRDSLQIQDGIPVVGFVGRLTEDKGLIVLAKARRLLSDWGIDYQLLVVGGFDDSDGERILAAINVFGRPAIVTGAVPKPAVYYRLMDVFCLPTLREGFPNVTLEASASSLPTVTTDATGAIDSVVDGVTGVLTRSGDPVSLAEGLMRLVNDVGTRVSMGEQALKRVKADFAREHVWKMLGEFYSLETASSER